MYHEVFELHAEMLKALAHPRRLEIIHLLRDQELPVSDIHSMLDLPQANISQHLTILRKANLVSSRRDGKQIWYRLSDPRIIKASDLLRAVMISSHPSLTDKVDLLKKMQQLVPLTQDPVCQMRLSPKTAGFHLDHKGIDYYFCASGCYKLFTDNPEAYVKTD